MKKNHIILLLGLFAVIQVYSQEKVSLSYKMEQGNTYRYKSEYTINSATEMMGNEMKGTTEIRHLIRFEVDSLKANGNMYLIISKEEASVHSNMMGRDTTIEQSNDIGKKTGIEIAPNGDKVSTTLIDSTSPGTDLFFGNNELGYLPAGPVAIGETWNKTSVDTTDSEGQQIITTTEATYVLAGREEKNGRLCYKITYRKASELTGKLNQMGMDMFLEGEGETAGTFWFDNARGILIADESTMDQDVTIAITGQSQMTIPSTQSVKTRTYLIE